MLTVWPTLTLLDNVQAGILAVGGTQEVVVLVNGKPVAKSQMKVTLSADQRVYDGAISSDFLQVCLLKTPWPLPDCLIHLLGTNTPFPETGLAVIA